MRYLLIAALVALPIAAHAQTTQGTLAIKDGLGNPQTVPADLNGANKTPHSVPEIGGAPVSSGNPLSIGGSVTTNPNNYGVGTDSSGSAPSAGNLLTSFTVTNPGAYYVQNQSAVTLQVQFCASVGTNCTTTLLAPGAGANAQGADTTPSMAWFTGYVAVNGAAGSQFAARHN